MSFYRGMTCENVTLKGDKGTPITAYVAKPAGAGPFPGVVLIHHLPGWSELYIETTRRFAHHGYIAICAHLYEREGGGSDGNPDDVAAKVRADGGIADSQMVGDTAAAVQWMRAQPNLNGKVGVFGSCSGGRHAFIYACQKKDVDACIDLWGGRVVMGKDELNAKTPLPGRAVHGRLEQGARLLRQAPGQEVGGCHVHVDHRDRPRRGHGQARRRLVSAHAGRGRL